ncbi:uncharacterized protein LOC136028209 [Artemia franciscana]|uniref:Geminin n=1 Tax=Artemia franciscana TaxID=6661 RepID=A0AA88HJ75_ARTSF|nr:hypothetical protein QYM36_014214 [Artemia franciscana]
MNTVVDPRRKLKTIQQTAEDKKGLVGRNLPKEDTKKKSSKNIKVFEDGLPTKKKIGKQTNNQNDVKSEGTQTDHVMVLDLVETMTSDSTPPEYYVLLAEQRRVALEKTLEENMNLHNIIRQLRDDLKVAEEELVILRPFESVAEDYKKLLEMLEDPEPNPLLVKEEEDEDEVLARPINNDDD